MSTYARIPSFTGKSGQQIFDLYQHYAEAAQKRSWRWFPWEAIAPRRGSADYSLGAGRCFISTGGIQRERIHDLLLRRTGHCVSHEGLARSSLQFSIMELSTSPPSAKFGLNYNAY